MSHIRISRAIVFAAIIMSLLVIVSAPAAAQRVGFYGGYWGGPFWGYPAYGYGPYGYYPGRALGEVHLKSPDSNAEIFINGALAGRAHDLKRFYLAPGTYNIEQRIGTDVQKQRVYVIANRSLKLEFDKPGVVHNPPPPPPAPGPNAAPAPAPEGQK